MNNIFSQIISSNHHAFLINSINREKIFQELKNEIEIYSEENNFSNYENLFLNLKLLDIEKAREIISFGNKKFNKIHFICISFYSITLETQNALLKFLEDTNNNLKIIFIISNINNLLSTIISRMYKIEDIEEKNVLNLENKYLIDENKHNKIINLFLKTKKTERMKLKEIIEILEKEDEYAKDFDKKERKDREIAEIFLLNLEKELFLILKDLIHKSNKDILYQDSKNNLKYKIILKNLLDLQDFKKYIKLPSSSPKTIFEYLSLSVIEL